jgi:hypothetical protein
LYFLLYFHYTTSYTLYIGYGITNPENEGEQKWKLTVILLFLGQT